MGTEKFITILVGKRSVGRTADWLSAATRFDLGKSKRYLVNTHINGGFGRSVVIESRDQMDGSRKWVVMMDRTWVLGKDDQYHYEPMPSSRTDEFIANTRFDNKEDALDAVLKHEDGAGEKDVLTVPGPQKREAEEKRKKEACVWVCNECGSKEYTGAISEADLKNLQCSSCGGNEFHKETTNKEK